MMLVLRRQFRFEIEYRQFRKSAQRARAHALMKTQSTKSRLRTERSMPKQQSVHAQCAKVAMRKRDNMVHGASSCWPNKNFGPEPPEPTVIVPGRDDRLPSHHFFEPRTHQGHRLVGPRHPPSPDFCTTRLEDGGPPGCPSLVLPLRPRFDRVGDDLLLLFL